MIIPLHEPSNQKFLDPMARIQLKNKKQSVTQILKIRTEKVKRFMLCFASGFDRQALQAHCVHEVAPSNYTQLSSKSLRESLKERFRSNYLCASFGSLVSTKIRSLQRFRSAGVSRWQAPVGDTLNLRRTFVNIYKLMLSEN